MVNYDSLINAVKAAVKTNGTGAITGATLQATLLGTIEALTVGFQFMGVATPETTPDSNDKKEFYLGFAGTYANFGSSVTVPEGSVILFKKNNGAWSSQVVKITDPVSVSQNSQTGHTDIKIGSNTYPVASVSEVPDMEQINNILGIRVLSSDNAISSAYFYARPDNGEWIASPNESALFYKVKANDFIHIKSSKTSIIALLSNINNVSAGNYAAFIDGESMIRINAGESFTKKVPTDCFLYVFNISASGTQFFPDNIYIRNGGIVIGQGGDFDTLKEGLKFAYETGYCRVYVLPQTFDLMTEFENEILNIGTTPVGNLIGNGIHIIFASGCKVNALYSPTGSDEHDTNVMMYFNPFLSDNTDYIVENLDIVCKNTRYCVHDECYGVGIYTHKYINCRMKYINDCGLKTYKQCIGGGLGQNGYIEVNGGVYQSVPYSGDELPISYHNGDNANAESNIFIKNIYLAGNGRLRFGAYGPSTNVSKVVVNGCSMGNTILNQQEQSGGSATLFELTEWNNIIRN